MTLEDASNFGNVRSAERDILHDDDLSITEKARLMGDLDHAAAAPKKTEPWMSFGDLGRGAIGAGLGGGLGALLDSFSGSDSHALRNAGAVLGGLFNMGKIGAVLQDEIDRRNAFRYAFLKQAYALGLHDLLQDEQIKTAAVNFAGTLPFTPELVAAPVDAAVNLGGNLASDVGALAGAATSPDATDEQMTRMLLERRQLEGQASGLEAQRHQAILRKVLDKRYS